MQYDQIAGVISDERKVYDKLRIELYRIIRLAGDYGFDASSELGRHALSDFLATKLEEHAMVQDAKELSLIEMRDTVYLLSGRMHHTSELIAIEALKMLRIFLTIKEVFGDPITLRIEAEIDNER